MSDRGVASEHDRRERETIAEYEGGCTPERAREIAVHQLRENQGRLFE